MDFKRNSIGSSSDDPPLSRLFIIGPKTLTEEDYRNNFDTFGHIDEIWMVKDKNTGEYKGRIIQFASGTISQSNSNNNVKNKTNSIF